MKLFIRQEIPVAVKLTGNVNRWSSLTGEGEIASVEVEPQAEGWKGRTAWINVDKLMWGDKEWEPVEQDELERMCHYEADKRDVAKTLCVKGAKVTLDVGLIVAERCIQAAREQEISVIDLIEQIEKAGRLGDLVSGVSIWSILEQMDG